LKLTLDLSRFNNLIALRFGTARSLESNWNLKFGDAPHRETLGDWRRGKRVPGSFEIYLKLCACLDVDPVELFDTNKSRGDYLAEHLLWSVLSGLGGVGINASNLVELFGPRPDWPSNAVISKIYSRQWYRNFFKNEGSLQGHYQSVSIRLFDSTRPQVFHFAFRLPSSKLWRTYGYVSVDQESVRLVHLFGKDGTEKLEKKDQGKIMLQTHFGNGQTDFCVASLKKFSVDLVENSAEMLPLCFNI
jgi:hypothetical protein